MDSTRGIIKGAEHWHYWQRIPHHLPVGRERDGACWSVTDQKMAVVCQNYSNLKSLCKSFLFSQSGLVTAYIKLMTA
ncbi:putative inositol transporter 2 [Clarias magur]|uniref:Putative inositol transporter 2 n=1 Tax=Clarias magur TaxID=1594786 RepID=A0A8J4WUM1_CLAMG|nr:putative inositol transporter 2 [Clarias magur]